jgi:type II secretory pathway pseudopilin PulG
VLAIIAIVVPFVVVLFGNLRLSGSNTPARRAATLASMKTVESMLKTYNLDNGVYPPSLQTLLPKYTERTPIDAWNRAFQYANTPGDAHPFILYSTGESGTPGNPDNIDYWTDVSH